mgnify:CR=1 FL=1
MIEENRHDHEIPASHVAPAEHERLVALTRGWLEAVGEDTAREGLVKTPERVAKAWEYITRGYGQTLEEVANDAVFEAEDSQMVIVKDIEFYSMCEHHMLPFFGRAHIGYVPDGKILGLSKFARITDMYTQRLQVQERITTQIATALEDLLQPLGVGVVLEAYHLCMAMRGVEKQQATTITTTMRGGFRSDSRTRMEFMETIRDPFSRR